MGGEDGDGDGVGFEALALVGVGVFGGAGRDGVGRCHRYIESDSQQTGTAQSVDRQPRNQSINHKKYAPVHKVELGGALVQHHVLHRGPLLQSQCSAGVV